MDYHIQRMFVDEIPGGPGLAVTEMARGSTLVQRYQSHRAGQPLATGEPLVLIVRSEPLNSPDRINVAFAEWNGRRVTVTLESQHYVGVLFGNEVSIALIEVALGELDQGGYEVLVVTRRAEFLDSDHPEKTMNPTSATQGLTFYVQ